MVKGNIKGDKGATGATGPKGADGAKGVAGVKGDKGATGVSGPKGLDGTDGINGIITTAFNGVPANTVGKNGDLHINTLNYDFFEKKDGVW